MCGSISGLCYVSLICLSYDKTTLTYTLTISGVREDKHIQAQAEKLSEEGPVAEAVTRQVGGESFWHTLSLQLEME